MTLLTPLIETSHGGNFTGMLVPLLEAQLKREGILGRLVSCHDRYQPVASDAAEKFILRNDSNRIAGFVLCSSTTAPGLVTRGIETARLARQTLGVGLSDVIL